MAFDEVKIVCMNIYPPQHTGVVRPRISRLSCVVVSTGALVASLASAPMASLASSPMASLGSAQVASLAGAPVASLTT